MNPFASRFVVAISFCLLTGTVVAQESQPSDSDPRVGTRVMITVAGAQLRTPEAVVWKAYIGQTFQVSLTNGEWLWIAEKKGWLWEKETIPFDGAVEELTQRLKKDASADNYHLRGIAFAAGGDYQPALQDYTASLKLQPNDAGVLNNRGQAYYYTQDYENAVRDFDAAIAVDAKHFVAMNNRALCRIATKEWDAAIDDLNRAIQLNPEYPEALNNRGIVHSQKRNDKAAVTDLTAAIEIDPAYSRAYENRSFAYRNLGQIEEAITDLHTAIEQNSANHKPVNDLAWIYATTSNELYRRPEDAVKLATKACEMTGHNDPNTLDTLATAYAAAGDFDNAIKWIDAAIDKAGNNATENFEARRKLFDARKVVVQ